MFLIRQLSSFHKLVLFVVFSTSNAILKVDTNWECLLISSSSEWIQMMKILIPDQDSWFTRALAM